MTKMQITLGDIFAVRMENSNFKYFQYVADDSTQLNSQVIRIFKTLHAIARPDIDEIVKGPVDFYAHTFLKKGLNSGYWDKIGKNPHIGANVVSFRNSNDYGNLDITISDDWHVWKINEPFIKVGKLEGENQSAEIGVVIAPDSIVYRMRHGKYDFVYPKY